MAPLWRDCVEFLRSAKLPEVNITSKSLEQLAVLLSDGVILCMLARLLRPESVEESKILRRHSMNQRSNFLSSNNITLFLTSCRQFLKVPEEHLFSVEDLSDYQNFEKVLKLISYLSRTGFAQELGLRTIQETTTTSSEYVNLPDSVEEHLDEYIQLNEAVYEVESRENENIEQNLAPPVAYTSVVAGAPLRGEYVDSINAREASQNFILREFMDFEHNLLEQLKQLASIYYQLENHVTRTDLEGMFYKILELTKIHQNFYDELKQAAENSFRDSLIASDAPTIGSICLNYKTEIANAYKQRIIGLDESIKILKNLTKVNDAVQRLLNDQLLIGVLENPIQKLCFYGIILKNVIEHSDDEHFREDIKLARESFVDICQYLDRISLRIGIVKEFASRLRDFPESKCILINYGNLIYDDQIDVIRSSKGNHSSKRPEKRYVFLFDTYIIFCKKKNLTYEFLEQHELKHFKISSIREPNSRWFSSTLFQWTLENAANGISYNFIFQKKKECQRVHRDFKHALKSTMPSGNEIKQQRHKIRTKIYSCPTICDGCGKLFDVLGHNCERCHRTFDIACLKKAPCSAATLETSIRSKDLLQVIDVQEDAVYVRILGASNESTVLKLKASDEVYNIDELHLQETIPRRLTLSQHQLLLLNPLVSECALNIASSGQSIDSKIWYHGNVSQETADQWLSNAPIGTFFFRFGKSQHYSLSIRTPEKSIHVLLATRFTDQSPRNILMDHRFNTFEEYIAYFRRNHFDDPRVNMTLNYALIRRYFRANFAFTASSAEGVVQVRPGDIITMTDTSEEEKGFWQATIDEKTVRLPWALVGEFCESILV